MKLHQFLFTSIILTGFLAAQTMNIHTKTGTDSYNLADIDSITFDISFDVPTDGLILYYPFSGNANDASGNGKDATVEGAALTTDKNGVDENAYFFDGSSRMTINPDGMPQNSDDAFTISVWLKPDTTINAHDWRTTVYWGSNPQTNGIVSLGYHRLSLDQFEISFSFYANDLRFSKEGNLSETWFHIAATYDGLNRKLYLNNTLVAEDTTSHLNITNLRDFFIGYRENYFIGKLDEIRIYNRALKPEEIGALYHAY